MAKRIDDSHRGRILCVTSNFPRWTGDSTTPFVLHLAQDLQDIGWQVDVLAPHADGAAVHETLGDVKVERFRYLWPPSQQTVCYQGGALINLRKQPWNYLKLPPLIGAEFTAVRRGLATQSYDLLHTHWLLPQGLIGALAARAMGVPHVTTAHGSDIFSLKGKWLSVLKRYAATHTDAVTANSSVTEAALLRLAPNISMLRRIPMGVSTTALTREENALAKEIRNHHRKGRGPLLVFVGRVVAQKGIEDLIRAVNLLRYELPDCKVLIVGEGQDRDELERLSIELGLNERVEFRGWIDPTDVKSYLAAADIFVGPSRQARDGAIEAQGLTFIEAMAAGTAVVATRVGGIIDSVIDEETGLLVEQRSPDQIASAIRRLTGDQALARNLTVRARQMVWDKFSRESTAQAFSHLFSELLAARH